MRIKNKYPLPPKIIKISWIVHVLGLKERFFRDSTTYLEKKLRTDNYYNVRFLESLQSLQHTVSEAIAELSIRRRINLKYIEEALYVKLEKDISYYNKELTNKELIDIYDNLCFYRTALAIYLHDINVYHISKELFSVLSRKKRANQSF